MIKIIKKILSEYSDFDIINITNDMSIKEDLFLDEGDMEEVLSEIQDYFGFQLDDSYEGITYVSDLISAVKEAL